MAEEISLTFADHYLMLANPDEVARLLQQRSLDPKSAIIRDIGDFDELKLLDRNVGLVNLALAKWGRDRKCLYELLAGANATPATRLAVLENEIPYRPELEDIFGHDADRLKDFFASFSRTEIYAVFKNTNLSNNMIRDTYSSNYTEHFKTDPSLLSALHGLAKNRIFKEPELFDHFIDSLESNFSISGLWKLADTTPINIPFAHALSNLFEQVEQAFSNFKWHAKVPAETIERWRQSEPPPAAGRQRSIQLYLDDFQMVRFYLAKLSAAHDKVVAMTYLGSDDVAVRCAGYSLADLNEVTMKVAIGKDSQLVFGFMVSNRSAWKDANTRNLLYEALLAASGVVEIFDTWSRRRLNQLWDGQEASMKKAQPSWFISEVEGSDVLDEIAARELYSERDVRRQLDGFNSQLSIIQSSVKLIAWGVALIFIYMVFDNW